MLRPRCVRLGSAAFLIMLAILQSAAGQSGSGRDAYLEAVINGLPTGLVAHFEYRGGTLVVAPDELRSLGLVPQPVARTTDGLIDVGRMKDVTYAIDVPAQIIRFAAAESALVRRKFDAQSVRLRGGIRPDDSVKSVDGAVLNYLVFGSTTTDSRNVFSLDGRANGFSAALDAHFFSSAGTLSQSGIVGVASGTAGQSIRLDTTWSYDDPHSLLIYRAGDLISGGLLWTRPFRMGGVQVQRSFALRPDLITMPLPALTGSAAVPSTVDVYFNNVKTYSQNVPAGPFEISNLPVLAGGGMQRVVVRDALGRQTVTSQPFYASPKLLRKGLYDFSVEAGVRRYSYSVKSNDYDSDPVASATLRGGLSDRLTVEAHAEGASSLINGGAGIVFPTGNVGVASIAVAGSGGQGSGMQVSAGVEVAFDRFHLFGRVQQTWSNYRDLASLPRAQRDAPSITLLPPRQLYQAGITIPSPWDASSVTLTYSRLRSVDGFEQDVVGASYARALWKNTTLFANAFGELHGSGNIGVFAGFTVALDDGVSATASISRAGKSLTGGIDISKSQSSEPGTYGWNLRDHEGAVTDRAAGISYRTSLGKLTATAQQFGRSSQVTGQMEGSIAAAGGGIFLANRIDDTFAVVDAGAPDVSVSYENRPAGRTDAHGRMLITGLRAFEPNLVTIDPNNLPVNAVVARTKASVVPSRRGAVLVDFGVSTEKTPVRGTLRDENGKAIAVGSSGTAVTSQEKFIVGYDGEIYLDRASPGETLDVQRADGGNCRAVLPRVYSARMETLTCR